MVTTARDELLSGMLGSPEKRPLSLSPRWRGGSVQEGLFPGPEPTVGLDEESPGRSRLLGADRVLSGVASAGKLPLVWFGWKCNMSVIRKTGVSTHVCRHQTSLHAGLGRANLAGSVAHGEDPRAGRAVAPRKESGKRSREAFEN